MNAEQIKQAVDQGKAVHWKNDGYIVTKATKGDDYYINFIPTGGIIGLTWMDGITLNGNESDFYIKD